jgi:Flp pilus assembly pilin Flp
MRELHHLGIGRVRALHVASPLPDVPCVALGKEHSVVGATLNKPSRPVRRNPYLFIKRIKLRLRRNARVCRGRDTSIGRENMGTLIRQFLRSEHGATAIEYGLIASGIAVAIILVVQGVGTNLNNTFGNVSANLK